MDPRGEVWLRRAFALAASALSKGNAPFGAVLVGADGRVLHEAENTVHTSGDCLAHAELNVLREASLRLGPSALEGTTVYTSAEPCPMCAGAMYWSGVARVVFGIDTPRLMQVASWVSDPASEQINLSCREVLERGQRKVEIEGPALADEAAEVLKCPTAGHDRT